MWVFMFIPVLLYLVAGVGELMMQCIENYRMEHPSISHLNYRNSDVMRVRRFH